MFKLVLTVWVRCTLNIQVINIKRMPIWHQNADTITYPDIPLHMRVHADDLDNSTVDAHLNITNPVA